MTRESRLTHELRKLLTTQRTAALGTIGEDGTPFVSRVPFAAEPSSGRLVIHVSTMAAHTGNLQARPDASLLVAQPEVPGEPVHALPRVTLQGRATTPEVGSEEWQAYKSAYLKRFPDAESMTKLKDFRFVAITATRGRHVDGFGRARDVEHDEIVSILSAPEVAS